MSVPKVLTFIDWYKPYFKAGGPVRSLVNMVEHLQGRVDFHIVTGDRDYTANTNEAGVPTDQWIAADAGEQVYHASPEARSVASWRQLIRGGSWDLVYINGLYSRWSTILPLWVLRGSRMRRIVAVRGMLAAGPMRQSALKKRLFLWAMKRMGCFRGVEFQATNTEEKADILRWIGPKTVVHVVPNLARKVSDVPPKSTEKKPGELRLISVARIAEEKNTLFAIERLMGVKGRVRFDLYGTVYDEAYFARCQEAIRALPAGVEVHWHGQLANEAVAAAIGEAHVLYMPSVGENFGHAMLEALIAGRPLLISDRTPWKGLDAAAAGWDLPLEDPARFTAALQQAVDMDQAAYDRLVHGAYAIGARYLNDPDPVERSYQMFAQG
ncbi:MAG TPA: glycosyltransferase [Flavobacteriales bacterium]|nr:glycosyltransferase [Flavobacteriales bacterium]